jgi:signal transduction histidine kinase
MRGRRGVIAGVLAVALIGAAGLELVSGASVSDTVTLLGAAALGSLLASIIGWFVLRAMRERSIWVQVVVIALSSTLATIAGVLVAAEAMFISTDDLRTLLVVVVVSAAVAVGAAVQFSRSIDVGARQVGDLALRMGDGEPVDGAIGGAPSELTALASQLTEVSERLAASRRHERALEASRRELVAWVSHDLRSPLATIRAVAEALDDGVVEDPETVGRYHHQIRQDAERLSALVDDLFELSRINSGAVHLDRQVVRLRDLVGDVIIEARPQAEVKGIALVDRMSELPAIPVSSQELRRALHNLIDNAIRHTPPGGTVVVETLVDADGALLSIVDECGGIPDDDLSRVFDVAFRGDAARIKDQRGGGLGLAIAKGLVEAHQGSIEVANQPLGCRFTVRLPLQPATPASAPSVNGG